MKYLILALLALLVGESIAEAARVKVVVKRRRAAVVVVARPVVTVIR